MVRGGRLSGSIVPAFAVTGVSELQQREALPVSQTTIIQPPETGVAPPEEARRFPGTKPRMLLIVNPWATSVSARLKNLVVYALRGRYDIEAVETQARNHATALTREAVGEGFDLVVAFGGDGTLNEVVNGLAGLGRAGVGPAGRLHERRVPDARASRPTSSMRPSTCCSSPTTCARGASTWAGSTAAISCSRAASASTRRRREWVDSRPWLKSRSGDLAFTIAAAQSFLRNYRAKPPSMVVEVGGRRVEGVSAMVQNSDPYTYFGSRPLRLCEDISIDNGALSVLMMRRATDARRARRAAPTLLAQRAARVPPPCAQLYPVQQARVVSLDGRPLPMEVDGDYIGTAEEFVYEAAPGALTVIARPRAENPRPVAECVIRIGVATLERTSKTLKQSGLRTETFLATSPGMVKGGG